MYRSVTLRLAAVALLLAACGGGARAQSSPTAIVVAACGTPPVTYNAGISYPLTMNTSGQLCNAASGGGGGSGTVTSVGETFTGGLISVAGSPVTTAGTFALTVAGTSGGIPYFSSASTWATSAALAANALVIGGGAGASPASTTTGTGVVTALGVNVGSAGSFVVNGGALGTPSSGTLTNATGLPIGGITGLGSNVGTALAATLNGSGALVATTGASLVTPALGVATATSLAVGGATLGGNAVAVTGNAAISGSLYLAGVTDPGYGTGSIGTSNIIFSTAGIRTRVGGAQNKVILDTVVSVVGGTDNAVGGFGVWNTDGGSIDTKLIRKAAANWQLGFADAAAPVAQTLSAQSVVAGTSNTAGALWKHVGSLSTGSGVSGDISFQTGGTGAGATVQNTAVDALVIKGATQNIRLPAITSDAALTDSTVCQDTTNHALFSGSGTLGICLGTSSARYKHDVSNLGLGLHAIMGLQPKRYFLDRQHGDPTKPYYGFLAEDGVGVLPELVGNDNVGRPNTFDYLGIVPILVRAVQEQQVEIEILRRMVR